jgi:1-acyl-sn-glycerol-3-phosphate acyltransferase
MKHVFQAIRVQSSRFRREAPELDEAVQVVHSGGALLLFPEGWMRRKEEMLMRQFGQGIWHILRRCPGTPVVCLWIEGGWGSYTSYANGPPTKNKRFDFWRAIHIGVQEPVIVPEEIMADHRQTRRFLRQRVLEARKHLGLDVPDLPGVEEEEKEEEKASNSTE